MEEFFSNIWSYVTSEVGLTIIGGYAIKIASAFIPSHTAVGKILDIVVVNKGKDTNADVPTRTSRNLPSGLRK